MLLPPILYIDEIGVLDVLSGYTPTLRIIYLSIAICPVFSQALSARAIYVNMYVRVCVI
jgi:hypothetical protein